MNKKLTVQEAQELLRKYRKGQCTKRELEILDRWYDSFDQSAGNEMDFAGKDELEELKIQMFENISNRVHGEEAAHETDRKEAAVTRIHHFDFRILTRIAAILIVGAGAGFFFYSQHDFPLIKEKVAREETRSTTVHERVGVEKTSPVYLSDGSVVWLQTGSRLKYPSRFTGDRREVTLTGEAFFDVAEDPDKPFIIHSADFTTRVLGTSFNIKAYGDRDAAEVVVVTGKVLVSVKQPSVNKVKELVLERNQKAIYSKKDHTLREAAVNAEEAVIAADKRTLAFDDTPLRDIVKVLGAKYDAEIVLSNEGMKDCMITADLTDETLEISIAILSKAVQASYTIDGKNITLHGNGCGVQP